MKYKEWKEYKCIKPLTLKHLYTPPEKATICAGEIWWLVSSNKSKNAVTLEQKSKGAEQTRCKITFEAFRECFEEIAE